MAFTLPDFNITCNIFTGPASSMTLRIADQECNLAYGRRHAIDSPFGGTQNSYSVTMTLLLPPLVDIRDLKCGYLVDIVEAPAGSGRFYLVASVDDIGKGFDNEHRAALLAPGSEAIFGTGSDWNTLFWPTPIP
jgi:hypothetical protein